jgi:hypothetical protein
MSLRDTWRAEDDAARKWDGAYRRYDLVKEVCIAIGVVFALALVLTVLFSSPDEKPSTVAQWSRSMPADFVTTAATELDGSSGTGGYGPPYNNASDGQHMAFLYPQKWLGVKQPVDTVRDFVIAPLRSVPGQPQLQAAIDTYLAAPAKQQAAWTTAYENALKGGTVPAATSTAYGPVGPMMTALLALAQSGGLDGALLTSNQFYQTNYTKPLLFMADGGLLAQRAQDDLLLGTQWGMMNETGSYPGQVWLWLYTFWYQIKPFSTSANADILVMSVMGLLSLLFILIPFLPVVRDIPRWIPLHRVIWRQHYRDVE